LTDDEIVRFWHGCTSIGWPFGPLCKLLLLCGQRGHKETAGMLWGEIDWDKRLWHLPGSRTKNGKPIDVHLSDLALKVLRGIEPRPAREGWPDFVFSTNGLRPVSGFAMAKQRLVKYVGSSDWTLHDTRRTIASGMARLGVGIEVADKALNHATFSTLSTVGAVYQQYQFAPERKEALDKWAAFIEDRIAPTRVVLRRPGASVEDLPPRGEADEDLPLADE
jgi:integrase